jgi:hypothetical protein
MWVDVEGFDSADGTKGRWMLAGAYSPARVSSAILKYWGLPVREGATRLEESPGRLRASGTMDGKEMVRAEIALKQEPCQKVAGTLNYANHKPGSNQIQITQIPYSGEACAADPVSVEVLAPVSDPFGQLKPVKLLWASEFKDGAAAFTLPVPAR